MTFEGCCNNFYFFTFLQDILEEKKTTSPFPAVLGLHLLMVLTQWPCWDIYQRHSNTSQAKEYCIMESAH